MAAQDILSQKYVSPEISLAALAPAFSRADIIFHEVDHAGASFEALESISKC